MDNFHNDTYQMLKYFILSKNQIFQINEFWKILIDLFYAVIYIRVQKLRIILRML